MLNGSAILYKHLKAAELRTAQFMYDQAKILSSGPLSQRQITKMGHGYAKAHPDPPLPASIINEQTGEFKEGWRIEMFYDSTDGGVMGRLVNDTRHADLIEAGGTSRSRMIARPIQSIVEKRSQKERVNNIENAILQAFVEELGGE